jgi:hypothetical protein
MIELTDTTRAHVRTGIIAATFAFAIAIGLLVLHDSYTAIANQASEREANRWADSSRAHAREADSLQRGWDSTNAELAKTRVQYAPVVAKVRQFAQSLVVDTSSRNHVAEIRLTDAANLSAREPLDTVSMATILRRGVDPVPYIVPRFIVDRWQEATHLALVEDSVSGDYWRQLREASIIISAWRNTHHADSLEIRALRSRSSGWCQRKCGIAIGVVGTAGAVYLASKAAALVTGKHGLTLSLVF